ncbi:unnamed protein product [Tilletia controversa]|nr:unnamed protein product [Tilletia controversa]
MGDRGSLANRNGPGEVSGARSRRYSPFSTNTSNYTTPSSSMMPASSSTAESSSAQTLTAAFMHPDPAWSSKTPRRRNRAVLSCLKCHQRRVKCDRKQPCTACVRYGAPEDCKVPDNPKAQQQRQHRVNSLGSSGSDDNPMDEQQFGNEDNVHGPSRLLHYHGAAGAVAGPGVGSTLLGPHHNHAAMHGQDGHVTSISGACDSASGVVSPTVSPPIPHQNQLPQSSSAQLSAAFPRGATSINSGSSSSSAGRSTLLGPHHNHAAMHGQDGHVTSISGACDSASGVVSPTVSPPIPHQNQLPQSSSAQLSAAFPRGATSINSGSSSSSAGRASAGPAHSSAVGASQALGRSPNSQGATQPKRSYTTHRSADVLTRFISEYEGHLGSGPASRNERIPKSYSQEHVEEIWSFCENLPSRNLDILVGSYLNDVDWMYQIVDADAVSYRLLPDLISRILNPRVDYAARPQEWASALRWGDMTRLSLLGGMILGSVQATGETVLKLTFKQAAGPISTAGSSGNNSSAFSTGSNRDRGLLGEASSHDSSLSSAQSAMTGSSSASNSRSSARLTPQPRTAPSVKAEVLSPLEGQVQRLVHLATMVEGPSPDLVKARMVLLNFIKNEARLAEPEAHQFLEETVEVTMEADMHKDPGSLQISDDDKEDHRRLFYNLYAFDSKTTQGTPFHPSLPQIPPELSRFHTLDRQRHLYLICFHSVREALHRLAFFQGPMISAQHAEYSREACAQAAVVLLETQRSLRIRIFSTGDLCCFYIPFFNLEPAVTLVISAILVLQSEPAQHEADYMRNLPMKKAKVDYYMQWAQHALDLLRSMPKDIAVATQGSFMLSRVLRKAAIIVEHVTRPPSPGGGQHNRPPIASLERTSAWMQDLFCDEHGQRMKMPYLTAPPRPPPFARTASRPETFHELQRSDQSFSAFDPESSNVSSANLSSFPGSSIANSSSTFNTAGPSSSLESLNSASQAMQLSSNTYMALAPMGPPTSTLPSPTNSGTHISAPMNSMAPLSSIPMPAGGSTYAPPMSNTVMTVNNLISSDGVGGSTNITHPNMAAATFTSVPLNLSSAGGSGDGPSLAQMGLGFFDTLFDARNQFAPLDPTALAPQADGTAMAATVPLPASSGGSSGPMPPAEAVVASLGLEAYMNSWLTAIQNDGQAA